MKNKIENLIARVGLTVSVFILGLALVAQPAVAQSLTPLEGSFLMGNNLVIKPLVAANLQGTNYYAGTNEWVKGGIRINSTLNGFLVNSNAVNVTNTAALTDVSLFANRDGSTPSTAINAIFKGVDARSTNTLIFKLVTVSHGAAETEAINKWQFAISANGTSLVNIRTNLPAGFLQGASQLRLASIESADGSNVVLNYFALKGFKP